MDLVNLYEYCLETGMIKEGRRTGNTTRMIDTAIQLIFEGKTVVCDYGCRGVAPAVMRQQNEILLERIKKRLRNEHPNLLTFEADNMISLLFE